MHACVRGWMSGCGTRKPCMHAWRVSWHGTAPQVKPLPHATRHALPLGHAPQTGMQARQCPPPPLTWPPGCAAQAPAATTTTAPAQMWGQPHALAHAHTHTLCCFMAQPSTTTCCGACVCAHASSTLNSASACSCCSAVMPRTCALASLSAARPLPVVSAWPRNSVTCTQPLRQGMHAHDRGHDRGAWLVPQYCVARCAALRCTADGGPAPCWFLCLMQCCQHLLACQAT